ncbi:hypothetical protein IFM89_038516 [Coptis chinensis]|uniref:Treslin n=1 Tax=Coptis chinensis TaxID=261450 RepID=A0A835M8K4_9MAGN|nr:hypothetical protein IFM89_038516 [Coptis chinensis]
MEESLNFSKTQRIVLIIDLNPLLNLENPKPYINSILSTSKTLLTFHSLSSSLFTFKFFFSSLSPLLSSSKLHSIFPKSSQSPSFNYPSQTLISLSQSLNSISTLAQSLVSPPKASFTASSVFQVVHDYIWESQVEDDFIGNNSSIVRSNLIVILSPVSRNLKCLGDFVDVEIEEGSHVVCDKFVNVFNPVSEGLVSKDIHCCWVDVNYEEGRMENGSLSVFEKGIKRLGWGFCSTDAIVLGSALVPFGMIYPRIGCDMTDFYATSCGKKSRVELRLTVKDVGGKPLECNCCELELLDLKHLNTQAGTCESSNSTIVGCTRTKMFMENQTVKISVKLVWRNIENLKLKDSFHDYILLRGSSLGEDRKEISSDGFFADKVLEMLCMETSDFTPGKPIWQVFLTFLYKNNYWALVSVSVGGDQSLMGILKPFTVHSALVCILDKFAFGNYCDADGFCSSLAEIVTVNSSELPKGNVNSSSSSQKDLSHTKSLEFQDGKKKNHRKSLKCLQELSWNSFCEAALRDTTMDLEDVYIGRESTNSKKMKFLKCWMKQAKKSCCSFEIKPNEPKSHSLSEEELKVRLVGSEQENDQPVSSSFSTEEASFAGTKLAGETIPVSCSETPEAFFNCISQKVQQGIESKEVDLGALAERLVECSINWFCLKLEKESALLNTTPEEQAENCTKMIVAELVKLLLREPKDLAMKYKVGEPLPSTSELSSASYTSENRIREYELQILFRMEMLRSKVEGDIEESAKRKMVKHICLLLDDIQYHFEGGCFGDVSLDKYVGRTIKSRFSHCLGDVVDRIYTKMDLLLYYDDDRPSGSQINSEDGDEAQRQVIFENEIGESASGSASTSGSMPIELKEYYCASPIELREKEHQCCLMEAQEKRERASRFSSFTGRGQYLQRVWAPKNLKAVRGKTDSRHKLPKRKDGRGTCSDVVCETPMTGMKRSCIRESNEAKKQIGSEIRPCGSVSKALFQDGNDA